MNRKIEALQEAAAQKSQESLDRVEKALEKMIKQGLTINFKTVADTANVSTAYLYKTPEIREKIETIRDQQKNQSNPQKPVASDNSKAVIISNLREEVKRVRSELEEFKKINQTLTGKLYQLQSADNLAERLKQENESLRQQVAQLTQSLTECENKLPQKVTPITEAKRNQVSERIKTALTSAGIQVNPTLTKVIKTAKEETVLDAIEAYKEAIASGNIDRPGGWLKRAIEEEWKSNGAGQAKTELEIFNEWFSAAKKKGLVMASQQTKDGIMICSSKGEWIPFGEMLTLHPLNTL